MRDIYSLIHKRSFMLCHELNKGNKRARFYLIAVTLITKAKDVVPVLILFFSLLHRL